MPTPPPLVPENPDPKTRIPVAGHFGVGRLFGVSEFTDLYHRWRLKARNSDVVDMVREEHKIKEEALRRDADTAAAGTRKSGS